MTLNETADEKNYSKPHFFYHSLTQNLCQFWYKCRFDQKVARITIFWNDEIDAFQFLWNSFIFHIEQSQTLSTKFWLGKYLPVWLLWRWQKSVSHLNNGIQIVIGWICWSLIGWCRKPCQKVPIRIWHKLIHFRFFISIKNLSFCIDVACRSIYSENLLEMGHFPRFFWKFHIERLNFLQKSAFYLWTVSVFFLQNSTYFSREFIEWNIIWFSLEWCV